VHQGYPLRPVIPSASSESRQALWAVVGNLDAGDLIKRTVRRCGIGHKFGGVGINLVEIGAIRRNPVICRSARNGSVEPPGGAISRYLWARWVLRDFQPFAVYTKRADIAVAEVRRVHEL